VFIPVPAAIIPDDQSKLPEAALGVGQAMAQGALLEAACEPKPGLVCPSSPGVHADMNIRTFMAGCSVLGPAMTAFAATGQAHGGDLTSLFTRIRAMGPVWEDRLLKATGRVNTHRGLLFAGGLVSAAAGYALGRGDSMNAGNLCRDVAVMTRGLCRRELATALKSRSPQTVGEAQYLEFGVTGIRGEAEAGLPSVTSAGLPALRLVLGRGLAVNTAMQHALLAIMAELDDSTVIHRAGFERLAWMRGRAKEIFNAGGMLSESGQRAYAAFCEHCTQKNVSPGGCADMLAVTVGIHLLERGSFGESPF